MKKIVISLIMLLAFSVPLTYAGPAGPGHSHAPLIEEKEAIAKASFMVTKIVKKGKLDSSWTQVKASDAQKKTFKNGVEWVVTFNNPKEKDPEKKTLYIFLDLHGKYLAANHTGN